jgi:hypothetical protein
MGPARLLCLSSAYPLSEHVDGCESLRVSLSGTVFLKLAQPPHERVHRRPPPVPALSDHRRRAEHIVRAGTSRGRFLEREKEKSFGA